MGYRQPTARLALRMASFRGQAAKMASQEIGRCPNLHMLIAATVSHRQTLLESKTSSHQRYRLRGEHTATHDARASHA